MPGPMITLKVEDYPVVDGPTINFPGPGTQLRALEGGAVGIIGALGLI